MILCKLSSWFPNLFLLYKILRLKLEFIQLFFIVCLYRLLYSFLLFLNFKLMEIKRFNMFNLMDFMFTFFNRRFWKWFILFLTLWNITIIVLNWFINILFFFKLFLNITTITWVFSLLFNCSLFLNLCWLLWLTLMVLCLDKYYWSCYNFLWTKFGNTTLKLVNEIFLWISSKC
jgi:hypothetical protein